MNIDQPYDVLIIGAGFSGICAAVLAKEQGYRIRMLEKGSEVGGVWRENTYPGAACDVPWYLYSFSFFQETIFSRPYPQQPEILQYQQDCARHFDLYSITEFNVEVTSCHWDDEKRLWQISTLQGRQYSARSLISAVGLLTRPAWPIIDGLETFAGPKFHSAQWDHDVPLEGRRIGVIGTGASAIQFIPEIAPISKRLTVFQRSAPYVMARFDSPHGRLKTWLFRHSPRFRRLYREGFWRISEVFSRTFLGGGIVVNAIAMITALIRRLRISDPTLRAKLTPDYHPGCKRILFTSNYYPTFRRENVALVTEPILRVEVDAVVDQAGQRHEVDVLILGTGFKATEYLAPLRITGKKGLDLHRYWQQLPAAHLGMTVPGFPNFFMMYGPNTNLGGSSIIFMIECQARYILQALARICDGEQMEVRKEIFEEFNSELQTRLSHSVWATGCDTWYTNANGQNPTNWPGLTSEYRRITHTLRRKDFIA